jgi:thiamine biosynthesis protein ThiS
MRMIVNGETLEMSNVETIQDLLNEIQVDPARVIVEINLSVIRKSEFSTFKLHDGDKVEIVNFVGGG